MILSEPSQHFIQMASSSKKDVLKSTRQLSEETVNQLRMHLQGAAAGVGATVTETDYPMNSNINPAAD